MLDKASVHHQAYSSYAYYLNETDIRLTIRVKKNNVKKIVLEYYDKYENVPHSLAELTKQNSTDLFDFYSVIVTPPHKRLCYFFRIYSGNKEYYYKQFGFTDNIYDGDFQLPYINPCDIYKIPDWINSAVFYQIFPDSFCSDGQTKKLPDDYFGGTLNGITNNLKYLKNLGINVIYLNPIFCSTTVHRYDVTDYFNIDPILGTKADFKNLVDSCHKLGIKVVLDAVINHSSHKNPMFLDVLKNGKNSKFANYYVINSFKNNKPYDYDRFAFENYMPKLNTSNPEVQNYFIKFLTYWIKEFNIDGWRFDVGNEIGHNFISQARSAIKQANPNAYMLGEIWHNSDWFLLGDEYDGVTNFSLKDILFKFAKNEINAHQFVNNYLTYYYTIPNRAIIASSNFLCNHDTTRVASEITNHNKLKIMIALQFIMLGTPLIYYGEEVGMLHDENNLGDRGARTPFDFNSAKNNELFDFYKKIIKLKTSNPCMQNEGFKISDNKELLIVSRFYKDKQIDLVVNNTNKTKKYLLNNNCLNYLTNEKLSCNNNLKLTPNSFVILIKE